MRVIHCPDCDKNLLEDLFHNNIRAGNGKYNICKSCQNLRQKITARNNRQKMIEYKGGKCSRCGFEHAACMDFHHLNPAEKGYGMHEMLTMKWKRIQKELDKCILLCSNCHRILHYEERK